MKNKNINKALIIIAMAIMSACSNNADIHNGKTPIVKVYDKYLYYEDIGELTPLGTSPEDSAIKVNSYIDIWVKKQLMIKKAETYLSDEQKDFERQLEEYRASLLIYRYKDKFINQKLDSTVSHQEEIEYFNTYPDNFKLGSNIAKCIFVQIVQNENTQNELRKLLNFKTEKDSIALIDFCKTKTVKFDIFGNNWINIVEAAKLMPQPIDEKNPAFKTNGTIVQSDGNYTYFLKVKQFAPSGSIAPFEYAEKNISKIIINKRKNDLINELETTIYKSALDNGDIKKLTDKE